MPFNGAGGFISLGGATFPAVPGTTILASQYNDQLNDIFGGLGQVITRNGQSPWTANLPSGGFKITGLADGAALHESVAWGQSAVTFGTVTAAITGASSLNVLKVGDTMTGTLVNTSAAPALAMWNAAGFIAGFDATGATRTGYLQFSAASGLLMASELAGNGIQLSTIGGAMSLSSAGLLGIGITATAGMKLDVLGVIRGGTAGSNTGMELDYSAGVGYLSSYNRGGALFTPMVFRGSTFNFAAAQGAAPQVIIDSSGRLGIGGASAGANLDVIGGAGTNPFIRLTDGTVQAFIQASTAAGIALIGTQSAHPFAIYVSGSERARIDAAGNMGLGKASATGFRFDLTTSVVTMARFDSTLAGGGYVNFSTSGTPIGYIGAQTPLISAGTGLCIRAENALVLASQAGSQACSLDITGNFNIGAGSGHLQLAGAITRFESAIQTFATSQALSVAHGGPRKPDIIRATLRCNTAEGGYAIGDEIDSAGVFINGATIGLSAWGNATNIGIASASIGFVVNKAGSAYFALTFARWNWVFYGIWL